MTDGVVLHADVEALELSLSVEDGERYLEQKSTTTVTAR